MIGAHQGLPARDVVSVLRRVLMREAESGAVLGPQERDVAGVFRQIIVCVPPDKVGTFREENVRMGVNCSAARTSSELAAVGQAVQTQQAFITDDWADFYPTDDEFAAMAPATS